MEAVSAFIGEHRAWAGFILALFVFMESLVLIGAFVPATPLMIAAGGLLAVGSLDAVEVIGWCVAGAICGDAISFWLGRRFGARPLRRPPFASHRKLVARSRLLTRRYGAASIFMGRFFGPLRAFVPAAAGMFGMRNRTFQIANAGSGILWVLVMLAPGYFGVKGLGELEILDDNLTLAAACAFAVIAGLIALLLRRRAHASALAAAAPAPVSAPVSAPVAVKPAD